LILSHAFFIGLTVLHASNNACFILAGHRACWSDSDEPHSKFVKYDSGKVMDFKENGPKYFETVLGDCRSVVSLVATAGNVLLSRLLHPVATTDYIEHIMLLYIDYDTRFLETADPLFPLSLALGTFCYPGFCIQLLLLII
jgi:hypothetical protein